MPIRPQARCPIGVADEIGFDGEMAVLKNVHQHVSSLDSTPAEWAFSLRLVFVRFTMHVSS